MLKKIWKQLCSDWLRVLMALLMACLIYVMRSDFFSREITTKRLDNISVKLKYLNSDIINLDNSEHVTSLTVQGYPDRIASLTSNDISITLPISHKDIGSGLINFTNENIKTPIGIKVTRIHNPAVTVNLERIVSKKVPVKIVFDSLSKLSPNYSVAKVTPFPREVTISGPDSKIKDIQSVNTAPVPLDSSVQNNFNYTAHVSAPSETTVAPAEVKCEIEIIQNFATRTIKVPVSLLMNGDKKAVLNFKLHPKEVELKVSGPSRIVHFLTPKDFHVFVNAENITAPGEYNLKVYCLPKSSVVRTDSTPSQLTVIVQKK